MAPSMKIYWKMIGNYYRPLEVTITEKTGNTKEVLYRATFVDIWQLKKVRGCLSWQKKFLLEERQMDQTRIPGPKWAHV